MGHKLLQLSAEARTMEKSNLTEQIKISLGEVTVDLQDTKRQLEDLIGYYAVRTQRGAFNLVENETSILFGLVSEDEVADNVHRLITNFADPANDILGTDDRLSILVNWGYGQNSIRPKLILARESLKRLDLNSELEAIRAILLKSEVALHTASARLHFLATALSGVLDGKVPKNLLSASHWKQVNDFRDEESLSQALYNDPVQIFLNSEFGTAVMGESRKRGKIDFSVIVPAKVLPYDMDIYSITPKIVWNSTLETGVRYEVSHPYIAATNDLSTFILITDLNICKRSGNLFLCPNPHEILTKASQRCEIALYLRDFQKARSFCQRTILQRNHPTFERKKDHYQYYAPKPLTLSVFCDNEDPVRSEVLEGLGTISIPWKCKGAVDNGVILTPTVETMSAVVEFNITRLDEIDQPPTVLSKDELRLLTENRAQLQRHLKTDPEAHNLHYLIDKLKNPAPIPWLPLTNKWHKLVTAVVVVIVLLLIIVFTLTLILIRTKLCRKPQQAETEIALKPKPGSLLETDPNGSSVVCFNKSRLRIGIEQ